MIAALLGTGGAQFTPPDDDTTLDVYPLLFPVAGEHSYVDTFGAPRSGDRSHQGTDIFADKGTPVVAAAGGTIIRAAIGDLSGRYIVIEHEDGWLSYYLHLNNDTPGTDDGLGGGWLAGIEAGATVAAGDSLDYIGDSGNAEDTPSHLHFELRAPDGTAVNSYGHLLEAQGIEADIRLLSQRAGSRWMPEYEEINSSLVGHFDPGGGFTADVVVNDTTAYLGSWGRPGACPNLGVRAIDFTDPEIPTPMGAFAGRTEFPGTSAETLWVGTVSTEMFDGDLAVVALRLCDNDEWGRVRSNFRGLAFYDVTTVGDPKLISTWSSGLRTQGSNSVAVAQRSDGILLVATTVRQSFLHTGGALGDVRFVDATDPASPVELADWDNRSDGRPADNDYDEEELHAHSVTLSTDGLSAWVSHWDAGTILLDLEDPTTPTFAAAVGFLPDGEGNRHSSVIDASQSLLIVNEEDFYPSGDEEHSPGWGTQHIYDVSDPTEPIEIAEFATSRSTNEGGLGFDGIYSAHDTVLDGSVAISSWYSDGVRIVDLSDPTQPIEIGSFVPPRSRDPVGYWVAPNGATAFPMVWGVDVLNDLIFVSDMNSGLWIVRFDDGTSTEDEPGPAPG
jgi:hypothetical protein